MRESTRHTLIAVLALIMIAASLAFYASWVMDWFRSDFLDPKAALRLSEALYQSGRPVDAFYVMDEARDFLGEEAFFRAHAAAVLGQDEVLEEDELDPSPEREKRLKLRLETEAGNPRLWVTLARLAAEKGRLAEAARLAEQGLAVAPERRGLLLLRADLVAQTSLIEAIPLYARLVNAHPDSYEARRALERLGLWAGKRESGLDAEASRLAREALEELYKARRGHPLVFSTLAMSAWARGGPEAARALVLESRSRREDNPGASMVEGALALHDKDEEKAVRLLTDAWEKDPADMASASKLAQLHHRQRGDAESALPYFIALYRQDPRYSDGEPARRVIRETLDARRAQVLKYAGAAILARYLDSEDASLRAEACAKAAEFKDANRIEALGRLLDDDVGLVRRSAGTALAVIAKAAPEPVKARKNEWLSSSSALARAQALELFASLDAYNTFPLVGQALTDPSPTLRFLAKTMVLDRYYKDFPQARKVRAEYLAGEKHPGVLAQYDRMREKGR